MSSWTDSKPPVSTQLPGRRVVFPATAMTGEQHEQTGLLHLPNTPAPRHGYPVVVYGHMTTGGCAKAAPSLAAPGHVEWSRISQGDVLCAGLLSCGIAVLRPDYEGIGSSGAHPYLIARSLAESMNAMMRARHSFDARLGDRWVAAGHSEGAIAALWASAAEPQDDETRLVGTSVFAPPTRVQLTIGAVRILDRRIPGAPVVSSLMALMLRGAAIEDDRLRELIETDGLSAEARTIWSHLDRYTLQELAAKDSWGGISPRSIAGARGSELWARLFASLRRNEIAELTPRPGQPPLRIDAGIFDQVTPAPLTALLIGRYRRAGFDVTAKWWPTHHPGTMHERHAPCQAVDWIAERFGS